MDKRRSLLVRVDLTDPDYSTSALQEWVAWALLAEDQLSIEGKDFNASDLEADVSAITVHHVRILDVSEGSE